MPEPFDGTLDAISHWHAKDFLAHQLAARSVQSKALNLARLDSVAPKRERGKQSLVPRAKKNNHAQLN